VLQFRNIIGKGSKRLPPFLLPIWGVGLRVNLRPVCCIAFVEEQDRGSLDLNSRVM